MWSESRITESREQGVGTRDREVGSGERGGGAASRERGGKRFLVFTSKKV
jgi:hypothetical protein